MNAVLAWLLEAGWQAGVLLAVISVLLAVLGDKIPAGWRYGLLLLVVLRLLLPGLPESPWSGWNAWQVVPASPALAWRQAWPAEPVPEMIAPEERPMEWPETPGGLEIRPARDGREWIFWAWLAGALELGGWLAVRQFLFQRWLRRQGRAVSLELREAVAEAAARAGLRRSPRIWLVEGVESPALSGLWRPGLVLPWDIEQRLEPGKLRMVLLHECLHLRRGDAWTHAAALAAWVLHWWNPAVWWLLRRLRAERELATDAAVLARLDERGQRTYGEALIELSERMTCRSAHWQPALSLLERQGDLRRRIVQIGGFTRASLAWSLVGAVIIALLAATLLLRQKPVVPIRPESLTTANREWMNYQLMRAVRLGDRAGVIDALDRGADVNGNNTRETALYWAVNLQDLPMVKLLLARGAQANLAPPKNSRPIDIACSTGNKKLMDLLIAAGATPNPYVYEAATGSLAALEERLKSRPVSSDQRKFMIRTAATAGQRATFDLLWSLLGEIPPEEKQQLLDSCYQGAVLWGRAPMLPHLQELGADAKKVASQSLTVAIMWNRLPEVEILLKLGASPNAERGGQAPPLRTAAGEGRVEMIKLLLKYGALPDYQDSGGDTALWQAAYMRQEAVCDYLIDHGANIQLKGLGGTTALWQAATAAYSPALVAKLLKRGGDAREQDNRGELLLCAVQRLASPIARTGMTNSPYSEKLRAGARARAAQITALLLDAGADANEGWPLGLALQMGSPEAARVLIERGATVTALQSNDRSALSVAMAGLWGQVIGYDTVKLLLDKGADPNQAAAFALFYPSDSPGGKLRPLDYAPLGIAWLKDNPRQAAEARRAVDLVVRRGGRFEVPGDERGADLLLAALQGDKARARQLIQAGASINTRDGAGWSPLSLALAMGQGEMAAWLIAQGADGQALVDTHQAGYPLSPLYLAMRTGQSELTEKLLAAGVKPDVSALYEAASWKEASLFRRLLDAGGDATQMQNLDSILQFGRAESLRLALERGAAQNSTWNSAERAEVYDAVYYDQEECLRALLQAGANPTLKRHSDQTPLALAEASRPGLVPVLTEAVKKWNEAHPSPVEAR